MSDKTYNDKMVTFTVLPIIYVWIMASSAVVYTGITRPEIVLENLDGFIALIVVITSLKLESFLWNWSYYWLILLIVRRKKRESEKKKEKFRL